MLAQLRGNYMKNTHWPYPALELSLPLSTICVWFTVVYILCTQQIDICSDGSVTRLYLKPSLAKVK